MHIIIFYSKSSKSIRPSIILKDPDPVLKVEKNMYWYIIIPLIIFVPEHTKIVYAYT